MDLEAIYRRYPRKVGKAKGLAKLARLVKTEEQYRIVLTAVQTMEESWRGASRDELQFCPHWSTFVNQERWLDEELPEPQRPARRGLSVRDILAIADEAEGA